jgi:hypothetical protein
LTNPDQAQVRLYHRNADNTWRSKRLAGQESAVEMPLIGRVLPLAQLYGGLTFQPRAVLGDDAEPG